MWATTLTQLRKQVALGYHESTEHQALEAAFAAYGLIGLLVGLIFFVFVLVIYWRIASKAGYPGVASLLMLVPLVNFIVIILFAFMEWPVEKLARAHGSGPNTAWQPGTMNPPAV